MRILHITADYPDPLDNLKPTAISNLLSLADNHENRVVSINRIGWRSGIYAIDFADRNGPRHRAVVYPGMPKGLRFRHYLAALAEWIIADCRAAGFVPDLIQAHKLTVEGTVGRQVAAALGVPYALSIQGNTDLKILKARPDLQQHFHGIWHGATVVFPFAVWARRGIESRLGERKGPTIQMPCPGPADTMMAPEVTEKPVLRTAFNLHAAGVKNATGLIKGAGEAARQVPGLTLEIIGAGDAQQFSLLNMLAERVAPPGAVRFLGHVPNQQVQKLFHEAAAYVMVSNRESFGLVFSEALLAGTPCLYPHGQGIDGYFEDGGFVLGAYAKDTGSIAAGMVRLVKEQAAFKERLGRAMQNGELDILTQSNIRAKYQAGLAQAVPGGAAARQAASAA